MVREKYGVRLAPEQRNQLEHLVRAGKSTARVTTRSRILLRPMQVGLRPGWPKPWMWSRARCSASSAALPKLDWLGRCKTGSKRTGTGSWRTGAKPT